MFGFSLTKTIIGLVLAIGLIVLLYFGFYAIWDGIAMSNKKVKKELADYETLKGSYDVAVVANDSLNNEVIFCNNYNKEITIGFQTTIDSLLKSNKAFKVQNASLAAKNKENDDIINHFLETAPCVKLNVFNKKLKLVDCPN